MLAPAALVASLALAGVSRYTASLSAAARYYTDLEVLQPIATTALELEPRLGMEHEEPTSLFTVAYYPRLVMIADSPPPQFFNQASLGLAVQANPTLRWVANASGCYGTNDFRVEYALGCGAVAFPTGPPALQPIPRVPTVEYLSASGVAGVQWRSSPLTATGTLSYLVQGGADAPTREVLPLGRGPSFSASLEWAAGRHDALRTSLSGSYYAFLREAPAAASEPLANNAWVSQLLEAWEHRLGPSSQLRLGLGVAVAGNAVELPRLVLRKTSLVGELGYQLEIARRAEAPGPGTEQRPRGAAEERLASVQLNLSLRVAPFVDFTSGLAYDRADAFAGLGWPLDRDWRLDGSLSAGVALDGAQRGQETATAQLAARWTAAQWLRLSTGLNALWQGAGATLPASELRQVSLFLGATFAHADRL
jgi:hypothetical protein